MADFTSPVMVPTVTVGWRWVSRIRLGAILACAFALGGVMVGLFVALMGRGPALRVLSQADAGSIALHDDRINIYSKVDNAGGCRPRVTHWLFTVIEHPAGHSVRFWVPIPEDGPVPVVETGVSDNILSVPKPAGLWPAEWFWLEDKVDNCGWRGWFGMPLRSESIPMPIDIEQTRAAPGVPVTTTHDGQTIVRGRSPVATR